CRESTLSATTGREWRKPLPYPLKSAKNKKVKTGVVDGPVTRGDPETGETYQLVDESKASRLARKLQELTGTEARVTSLGHVQRGGIPTPTDRLLCTLLGSKAAELLAEGRYNSMVAVRGNTCVAVPLEKVAGKLKTVPLDHEWIRSAHMVGTCMGSR
ncbi:MAG: 6-phosphofructokinase, partial [Planctomycetota bacterium]|nr:6-phosphofructokinase [Planctomycetota bacterium]